MIGERLDPDGTSGRARRGRGRRFGWVVVAGVAIALAAYVLLHTPIGVRIDNALGTAPDCVWRCGPLHPIAIPMAALFLVVAAFVAAWVCVRVIALRGLERLVAWGIVAFAFVVVPAALLGELSDLIGHPLLRPPLGTVLASLPAVVTAAVVIWRMYSQGRLRELWPDRPVIVLPRLTPLSALLGIVAIGLLALATGVGIAHPPAGFDELGYHLSLSVMFWHDGSLALPLDRMNAFPMASPGSAELWFGVLQQIGGEALATLGQLPFALLGAVGVTAFARRAGLSQRAAIIGGLAFLCAPLVVNEITRNDNDIVAAALVIAGATLLAAPNREWSRARVMLVGLAIALMITTKLSVLPAAGAIGLLLLIIVLRDRMVFSRRQAVVALLAAAGIGLLVVAPWWIRNMARYGNPLYPAVLPVLGRGVSQASMPPKDLGHVPATWLWPFYPWFEPQLNNSGMGAVFAVALVPGVLLACFTAIRRPLLILGVVAALSLPLWWIETRHEPRFLLGVFGLVFAFLPFVLVAVRQHLQNTVAVLLGIAVVASAGLTTVTGLAASAGSKIDRSEYYRTKAHIDPAVMALPSNIGLLIDDSCPGNHGSSRIYPLLGEDLQRSVARVDCHATTAEALAIMAKWRLKEVYVSQGPDAAPIIDARYPADLFTLEYSRTAPATKNGNGAIFRIYRLNSATLTPPKKH
jgi:hypothetical protein